jgi:hypothetical protein
MELSKNAQTLLMAFLSFFPGGLMATEEPDFEVESKTASYEVRKYGAMLVAETQVEASFSDSGNKAFKILADYIFGNNRSKVKIEMTAPVTQRPRSEKISMTAPVTQIESSSGFLIQFTMPKIWSLESLPEPNDARVQIREIPARRVAVYSYSGSWSESRYKKKLAEFYSALQKDNLKTQGEPVFARFNSPFQIWFLRRNEIWLELAETARP